MTDRPNISVKPILNTRLKGRIIPNRPTEYPLYIRMLMGYTNNIIPASAIIKGVDCYMTTGEFELLEKQYKAAKEKGSSFSPQSFASMLIEFERKLKFLRDIHAEQNQEFELSGIRKKLDYLYTPLAEIIEEDLSDQLRQWAYTETALKNPFSKYKSIEDNLWAIMDLYYSKRLKFPTELLQQIEFLFLFKAYAYEYKQLTDVISTILLRRQPLGFSIFLHDYSELLVLTDTRPYLPRQNKYMHLVMLFPPTAQKGYYIERLVRYKKLCSFRYAQL